MKLSTLIKIGFGVTIGVKLGKDVYSILNEVLLGIGKAGYSVLNELAKNDKELATYLEKSKLNDIYAPTKKYVKIKGFYKD